LSNVKVPQVKLGLAEFPTVTDVTGPVEHGTRDAFAPVNEKTATAKTINNVFIVFFSPNSSQIFVGRHGCYDVRNPEQQLLHPPKTFRSLLS
jgi:hypothetical protein